MFSISSPCVRCRVSHIASLAGRHVLFDVTQINRTRLRNGYQSFEKSLSRLRREPSADPGAVWLPRTGKGGQSVGLVGGVGFMYIDICTQVNFSPAFFSSHQSFRSGCAAKSTNFFQWWKTGWSLQTREIAPVTPGGQVRKTPTLIDLIPLGVSSRKDMEYAQ